MQSTKLREVLIVGLGNNIGHNNPYKNTKHNIGMEVVISVLNELKTKQILDCANLFEKQDNYDVAKIPSLRCTLLVPRLYMNENGKAIGNFMRNHRLSAASFLEKFKLLAVHDELDLSLGKVKFKNGGSAKGHNGVKSIIQHLGGLNQFERLQIGIDRPPASRNAKDVAEYVLSNFDDYEMKNKVVEVGTSTIVNWVEKNLK